MKKNYYFRVRVGKQTRQLAVVYEGFGGRYYTISNGKIINLRTFGTDESFRVDEKHSSKRWSKYFDYTINKDGLQVEYKQQIKNIDVRTFTHCGSIDTICFEAYE